MKGTESLWWGSGVFFGLAWILPGTSNQGLFFLPIVLSIVFAVIAIRVETTAARGRA